MLGESGELKPNDSHDRMPVRDNDANPVGQLCGVGGGFYCGVGGFQAEGFEPSRLGSIPSAAAYELLWNRLDSRRASPVRNIPNRS